MKSLYTALSIILFAVTPILHADTAPAEEELTALLHRFLEHVDEAAMHDRFWDDDLVYTSSNGTRRGKAEIMAAFDAADEPGGEGGEDAEAEPLAAYGAADIRIRRYGDVAVMAFRLLADVRPAPGEAPEHAEYLNTGTFLRRPDGWRVVAWQATRIPDDG